VLVQRLLSGFYQTYFPNARVDDSRLDSISPQQLSEAVMFALQEGSAGADVERLQEILKQRGFNPGLVDGDFGPATKAALIAFQRSEGLLADGIAGPRTQHALGLVSDATPSSVIPGVTVTVVSRMFPFTQVDNIRENLPFVCDGLKQRDLVDKPMVLMALATIRAESEGFEPISEGRSKFNTSPGGHPFDLYDSRRDLGNQGRDDGERFRGRGYIQLTGRHNYERHGRALGRGNSLIDNPDLANDPSVAGLLLATFLKHKERQIKEALVEHDLRAARRLVNGGSHGLDRFEDAFRRGEALL
jgi:peptidoglycan L-alanyl-D-glutamate endopeptidase CwlK